MEMAQVRSVIVAVSFSRKWESTLVDGYLLDNNTNGVVNQVEIHLCRPRVVPST